MKCPKCGSTLDPQARFCSQCGAPLPAAAEPLPSAPEVPAPSERKLVTILFSDIVGSTSMAGRLDPEEWKEIVGGAHRRVSQAVVRYGGTIAQLLGDGVLAFFGAPVTHEDDPIRAVRAALEIQASIRGYREELAGLVDDFQMRIGIHTGNVVVGPVGDQAHQEYLALGDPVHLAARLQGEAKPGGVLVSQATAGLAEGHFNLEPVGPLSLKGVETPVMAFQVVGPKRLPEGSRGIPGLKTPLVGRKDELDRLQAALNALSKGKGQVAAVTGEAGIGKTRLVEEARLQAMVAPSREIHWLEARALSYGENLSFWAINQLLLSDLGLSDGEPGVRIGVALKRRIRGLFGDEAPAVTSYLHHLMGAPLEGEWADQIRQLDGETRKHQTILALSAYLEKIAGHTPTVVLLEDAHWLDPSSLEALEGLLPLTDRVPLMLLLLMRVEREHGSWRLKLKMESEYPHRFSGIHLHSLTPDEAGRLAASLLATREAEEYLRQVLLERAGGNPFFLEELIRDLIERGLIVRGPQALRLAGGDLEASIPRTLEGVLSGRIDRLPQDDRRLLQLASVIGQSFLLRILEAISEQDPSALGLSLARLQRAEFLLELTCLPEREYAFRHSLTQQAAYQSMLVEQRKAIHMHVGEALERLFPGRRQEFLGLLAHHFELAGASDKAVAYLLEAGDRARLGEELPEAVGYYRRALPFLMQAKDWSRASRTWLKLGLVYQADFDFKAAHEANEAAFELAANQALRKLPVSRAEETEAAAIRSILRIDIPNPPHTLDPGKTSTFIEINILSQVFAGLTELDSETNIIPHIARSWEVLDGGRRYLFHLRDDARWTDGKPVAAADFEWAWKRNLSPRTDAYLAYLLDPIVGAREFRTGRVADPRSVGVRAIDPMTLEVVLEAPTAYFLYLTAHSIAYPLPERHIDASGELWWKPETIVSNGAFRLASLNDSEVGLIRNDSYFGDFNGNLGGVHYHHIEEGDARLRDYLEGGADVSFQGEAIPDEILSENASSKLPFGLTLLCVLPWRPPLNDTRVRKALAHAINRELVLKNVGSCRRAPASGGVMPPGMAGHSPGLALPYDPGLARALLAEAGYPGGSAFPHLGLGYYLNEHDRKVTEAIANQWRATLGIDVQPIGIGYTTQDETLPSRGCDIVYTGWLADYPDPHAFLMPAGLYNTMRGIGWADSTYDEIAEEAPHVINRPQRMLMYRQVDRILVAEQVLFIPLEYGAFACQLAKPWVRGYRNNMMCYAALKEVSIGPRQG
jgi:ABC-type oligopeptide transport system substrate-binding subunit/class 3 adenylate cyclase